MSAIRGVALLALIETSHGSEHSANPIRRVVTMLQDMQSKVAEEGKKEKELFDKFMCYCQTGAQDLNAAIDGASNKAPQTESAIEEGVAKKEQLNAEVAKHQTDRAESKLAIAAAIALRDKTAATYAEESTELKSEIQTISDTLKALQIMGATSSMGGGAFLQTATAMKTKKLAIEMDLSPADRDQLLGFLSMQNRNVGPAIGILSQMEKSMEKDLAALSVTEEASMVDHDALIAAKQKQIQADTEAVEAKIQRVGDLGVQIETMKGDLSDTQESLMADKGFAADLEKSCATKEAEWETRSKTRNEELLALADTIKILNDDDATELFKKTLPAPSLLQETVAAEDMRKAALEVLQGHKHHNLGMDLISLSLKGKKVNFVKIIQMCDNMVNLIAQEQQDDANKKELCEGQLDKAMDELKATETSASDLEKATAEAKELQTTLTDEIAVLSKELKNLDKQVADAMDQRREENEDYVNLMASNTAAKEVLGMAKNRMQKFYNPSMYEEPAAVSFIQLHSQTVTAPPPPPATFGAYAKKSESSNGILQMMDSLAADLDKEIQEAEFEEKNSQGDYEKFTRDASEKRISDSKAVADKDAAKAESEVAMQQMMKERTTKMKEALATVDWISSLHKDCDWLLKNYDTRREARVGETDALKKAKAVLSGADYSFVQKGHFLRRVTRA